MEISTGDLIGLTGLGVTVLGGAVALGKVWSKVNSNAVHCDEIGDDLKELRNEVIRIDKLTDVQANEIKQLQENSSKLTKIAEEQGKALSTIEADLKVILTKLEAR